MAKLTGVKKTTPDNLANDFVSLCKAYTDDVVDAIFVDVEEVANSGCEDLKRMLQPPPSSMGTAKPMNRRLWKNYIKGWTIYKKGGVGNSTFIKCQIHNKKHFRLTHLLEYGHATRDGKTTRAFKHIEPINNECVKRIEEDIPKIIKKGGKL